MNNDFITKSDLMNFIECPFAYKKAKEDSLQYFQLFISPFRLKLMEKGMEFENGIKASFSWEKTDFNLNKESHVKEDAVVSGLSVTNEKLGISGEPDLVMTANGELVPIEIKSHKDENATDPIEIAFYWLLLEPYRLKGKIPKGYYILRKDYEEKATSDITKLFSPSSVNSEHISIVKEKLVEIRNFKEYQPVRISACRDCALFKKYCFEKIRKDGCVSLLTAGPKIVEGLKSTNFNLKKISEMSPEEFVDEL